MSHIAKRAKLLGTALALAMLSPFAATQALAESFCTPGPGDQPEPGLQGAVLMSERTAPGGFKGHWCGMRLVGQHTLFNRGSYGDTQMIGHCVYSSMRDPSDLNSPNTGTAVLDYRVPSAPVLTQMLRTPAMIRAYSALEIQGNLMIGAFKDFGPNGTNPLDVYDVSDCLNPVMLSTSSVQSGNHDGWLTPDGKTYYGVPFGGARVQQSPSRADIHVTDLSDPANPKPLMTWNRLSLPADVQARTIATTNFHDASTNNDGTRLYLALYGGNNSLGGNNNDPNQRCANGLLILDSSDIALRRPNPQLRYISFLSWCDQQIDPDFGDGSTASAHATEYVIHENGKPYIVTTDESGGGLNGDAAGICAQRTYARMIDISDETNPIVVSTFKPDVNKPSNCAANMAAGTTGGMVHYIGFDDRAKTRLVIYAAANQGIRVVDFRDPAHPKEIAYYNAPRHTTTPATGQDFTRPDPRYDQANCFFHTGWNQAGLKTLELTNPEYNSCMRRAVSGTGSITGASNSKIALTMDAKRAENGLGALGGKLELNDRVGRVKISTTQLKSLGSVRDSCGASILPTANAVQFDADGLFNGKSASFRICVQDNNTQPANFYLTCTAGCTYSAAGAVSDGNLLVQQR